MEKVEELVEKQIGEFKQPLRFKYFIGSKSNVKFSSKEALILGKHLTGLGYDNVQFLLTILDEGTCNFDVHTEGIEVDKETRGRLLSLIGEKTISPTSFNNEKIVRELEFTFKISEQEISVYLAVEEEKPIEKLNSILQEEIEISDEQLDKLSQIFGEDFFQDTQEDTEKSQETSQESEVETTETEEVENQQTETTNNSLSEAFDIMKNQKYYELKFQLDELIKNVATTEMEILTKTAHKSKLEEKISLLETRIESLVGKEPSNGYFFFVDESENQVDVLDEKTLDLIKKKVSKVKNINTEAFMSLLKDNEFKVYFGKKNENSQFEIVDNLVLDKDVLTKISLTDYENGAFTYRGDMTWHELVSYLTKNGFEQDVKFDELIKEKK